jgi:hypothetical protein
MVQIFRRPLVAACVIAATAALAACSGDLNPVRDAAVATGVGIERRQAEGFIETTRPETLEYMPVGVSAAPRGVTAKPAADVKAAEAEMDAVRADNEARAAAARKAGSTPAPAAPPTRQPVAQ